MLQQKFYTFAEACQRTGASESALVQAIASGSLSAFVKVVDERAYLDFASGVGGVGPDTGQVPLAKWQFIGLPRAANGQKISEGNCHYRLTGWFRVESKDLIHAALRGKFGIVSVVPPSEGTGSLSDGDVFEIAWQDGKEVGDEGEWLGGLFPTVTFSPSIRDLWFSAESLDALSEGHATDDPGKTPARTTKKSFASVNEADKPLDTRERTTLLCIIGALANSAGLDLTQPMKAGDVVAAMAPELKWTGRAIGEHLKSVSDAMASRMR